jgi:hypothetical protein
LTIKNVIRCLRDGWYGNAHLFREHSHLIDESTGFLVMDNKIIPPKEPANCYRLFMHTIKSCDNKFIKLCPGLDGTMGNLIIDPGYVAEHEGQPIDMVVTNVANGPGPEHTTHSLKVAIARMPHPSS